MRQIVWKFSLAVSALLGCSLMGAQTSHANEAVLNQVQEYSEDAGAIAPDNPGSELMSQLNSVSQLTDVKPTDWAYQALQSLVERYGCIVGYPDKTYRGNRSLSRYEFAAGLNACMDRISELIAASTSDLVKKEDLVALQKMQEEFAAELAVLRGRVDALEVRTATLEKQQFSTTTKLFGNAIFAAVGAFGDSVQKDQIAMQYRVSLNLATSFTGHDALILGLGTGNAPLANSFGLPGTVAPIAPLGFPTQVDIPSAEGTLSSQFAGNLDSKLTLLVADYTFPIGKELRVHVMSSLSPFQLFAPTLNPYLDDHESGRGAITVFGSYNPIYTLVGGGTGVGFSYEIGHTLELSAGYLAEGLGAGNPSPVNSEGLGGGLFNGGYGALAQLTWKPSKTFSIAAVYINDYSPGGRFGFNYNALGVAGTAVANSLAGQDILLGNALGVPQNGVITNGYAGQFSWAVSPKFVVSGWFSTLYPRLIGKGDGNILAYALTFAFPDLGKKGNLLGLVVGAEPYLTRMGGNPVPFKTDIPLHIEAFYRYQVNDHIAITPGVIWLLAPNQDNNNPDAVIATLRTTFSF